MKNKTLVFTATYNEAGNIESFLKILLNLNCIDVLIVDDNSPDNTADIISNYKNKFKNLNLIVRPEKGGLDTAHKLAFEFAKKNDYQNLITLDADLSHDPRQITNFVSQLDKYPFVIGSRYIKGGQNKMKFNRYVLSYVGNKIIKSIFKINCNEFTTSYRGFNLKNLKNFEINNVKSKGYSFFMETVYQINKSGNLIKEIPIIFSDRTKGVSKIPKIESLRTLKNLLLIKLNEK
jgi:dolichol-phosphate mannosyltransferase